MQKSNEGCYRNDSESLGCPLSSRGFFLLDLVAIAMLFSPILRKNAENNANNLRKTCIIR